MGIRLWPFRRKIRESFETRLLVAALTDIGRVRSGNEDSYSALWGEKSPPGVDALIVVADGMGGHAAGEVASKMAVEEIVDLISGSSDSPLRGQGYLQTLGGLLQQVNTNVFRASKEPGHQGMGTTCTVAVIKESQVYVSHVGDSRAYLLRTGVLHQVSQDHSWVEQRVADGSMTLEQARNHPDRNVITRAIGLEPNVKIDGYLLSVADGDILLLCSDGLTTMVDDEEISDMLSKHEPEEACEALIDAANRQGGHDNITVAVARIIGGARDASSITISNDDAKTKKIIRIPKITKSVLRLGR